MVAFNNGERDCDEKRQEFLTFCVIFNFYNVKISSNRTQMINFKMSASLSKKYFNLLICS